MANANVQSKRVLLWQQSHIPNGIAVALSAMLQNQIVEVVACFQELLNSRRLP
jgi:hypothetical protein